MVPAGSDESRGNAATTRSGFILVSTYSWTIITAGVLAARFWQSRSQQVEVGFDDVAIVAATVVYLGATVSWQYAIRGGLGKDFHDLSGENINLYFKATYIVGIFVVFAMALAKLSSALLIERVVPQTRKAKIILFSMTAIFAIFATLAISFQCGIPRWTVHPMRCSNEGLAITVIGSNMATDLLLAFWMVPVLWKLSSDKEKGFAAAMLFGVRAIVAFVAGGEIWATLRLASSRNPTRDAVELVVLTQSVSSLSLILSSVPRIKRVIGVGGSGLVYPENQGTELTVSRESSSWQDSRSTDPKLVPSDLGDFTVTVSSKGTEKRTKTPCKHLHPDWQTLTMRASADEHASTSSLFGPDEQEGVMMRQDVIVSVEDKKPRKTVFQRENG
ncbi:hypothetical protein G6011_00743 [Alternaria panax]|uniref:Rhodopsin domain-containing protein n=1 Tax=Alternaria panax TaxID=48097 RepID=A0AAD4NV05_9PLEO|nr:hypothetical protein G6011_00743 [Alternaria panax]